MSEEDQENDPRRRGVGRSDRIEKKGGREADDEVCISSSLYKRCQTTIYIKKTKKRSFTSTFLLGVNGTIYTAFTSDDALLFGFFFVLF